jgi:hypothetical protein
MISRDTITEGAHITIDVYKAPRRVRQVGIVKYDGSNWEVFSPENSEKESAP